MGGNAPSACDKWRTSTKEAYGTTHVHEPQLALRGAWDVGPSCLLYRGKVAGLSRIHSIHSGEVCMDISRGGSAIDSYPIHTQGEQILEAHPCNRCSLKPQLSVVALCWLSSQAVSVAFESAHDASCAGQDV